MLVRESYRGRFFIHLLKRTGVLFWRTSNRNSVLLLKMMFLENSESPFINCFNSLLYGN